MEGTAQPGLQQLEVVGKVAQKLISRGNLTGVKGKSLLNYYYVFLLHTGHVFSGQEVIRDVRDDVLDASLK